MDELFFKPLFEEFYNSEFIQEITKSIKENNHILAFSSQYDNNHLWYHYADGHKGICVEYDVKNCGVNFIVYNCFPVFYDDSDFTEDIDSFNNLEEKFMLKALLKKGTGWHYEEEWRIVLNHDLLLTDIADYYYCGYDNKNYIKFLKPKVVFMGKDISHEDEKKIKGICQCRNIELYKMEHDFSQYKLSPKRINLEVQK